MVDISIDGITEILADPKVIFAVALKSGASGIILCHNHPSEELKPGKADIDLIKRLKQCGNFLEIDILDHLISKEGLYSFADEGII